MVPAPLLRAVLREISIVFLRVTSVISEPIGGGWFPAAGESHAK